MKKIVQRHLELGISKTCAIELDCTLSDADIKASGLTLQTPPAHHNGRMLKAFLPGILGVYELTDEGVPKTTIALSKSSENNFSVWFYAKEYMSKLANLALGGGSKVEWKEVSEFARRLAEMPDVLSEQSKALGSDIGAIPFFDSPYGERGFASLGLISKAGHALELFIEGKLRMTFLKGLDGTSEMQPFAIDSKLFDKSVRFERSTFNSDIGKNLDHVINQTEWPEQNHSGSLMVALVAENHDVEMVCSPWSLLYEGQSLLEPLKEFMMDKPELWEVYGNEAINHCKKSEESLQDGLKKIIFMEEENAPAIHCDPAKGMESPSIIINPHAVRTPDEIKAMYFIACAIREGGVEDLPINTARFGFVSNGMVDLARAIMEQTQANDQPYFSVDAGVLAAGPSAVLEGQGVYLHKDERWMPEHSLDVNGRVPSTKFKPI